jgi:hypothetical protein
MADITAMTIATFAIRLNIVLHSLQNGLNDRRSPPAKSDSSTDPNRVVIL